MTQLDFKLLPWQLDVMNSPARFKVVVAGRRTGKSRYAIVETLIKALQCKSPDASVLYIAPTIQMVKVLAWDALMDLGRSVIASSNINDGRIKLINGVSIYARGADNEDSLRGMKLAYAILDEAKDLRSNLFDLVIRPALSDMQGGALIIGTPSPDATHFRAYYDLGMDDETGEWKSWHFTTYDNPLIPKKELEAAKKTMSTSAYLQEYEASWDTAGANILKMEWFCEKAEPSGQYSTYIAIDPAGYESAGISDAKKKHLDFFAIAIVRVYDNGHWWVQAIDYGRWDVREAAVRVLLAIRSHKPICIGMERGSLMRAFMPYFQDLSRKNNIHCHIEAIPTSGNSKANRIAYSLQGRMEHGRITFNPKEDWMEFKKEMLAFPSQKVHDDLLDSCSMIDHLSSVIYGDQQEHDEYEVIDEVCGF